MPKENYEEWLEERAKELDQAAEAEPPLCIHCGVKDVAMMAPKIAYDPNHPEIMQYWLACIGCGVWKRVSYESWKAHKRLFAMAVTGEDSDA
jgi:hypothetical protein